MRKIPLFAVLSLSASACLAAGPVPRLTGEALVERYGKTGNDPFTLRDKSFLDGYLAGVADASEGKAWCDTGKVKTGEIDADVLWRLRDMRPEDRQKDAATYIVSALKDNYPCPRKRGAR